jgi:formate dehydrogenase maturation protein FdhE
MAQDAKEEKPPEAPEEIAKLHKYKGDADRNPRDIFWELAAQYMEKKDIAELAKDNSSRREALVNIGATVLTEEERIYRVKMGKAKLAEFVMEMVLQGGWEDTLERLMENLYERRRGPNLNMMIAFGNAVSKNEALAGWVKKLLAEGRPPEPLLAYISHLGDRGLVAALKEQLIFIAKSEINEPQLYALEALAPLVKEDAAVKKVFIDLMDDWDMRAKKVVLESLSGMQDADIGKKAVASYVYEFDPHAKSMLKEIIRNNKEAAKGEMGKYMGKYNEKVNKELMALAESIYGKKEAGTMFGAKKEGGSGEKENGKGSEGGAGQEEKNKSGSGNQGAGKEEEAPKEFP